MMAFFTCSISFHDISVGMVCKRKFHAFVKSPQVVMPDLIRHPEVFEFTGFRLSRLCHNSSSRPNPARRGTSRDPGPFGCMGVFWIPDLTAFVRNDGKRPLSTFYEFIKFRPFPGHFLREVLFSSTICTAVSYSQN